MTRKQQHVPLGLLIEPVKDGRFVHVNAIVVAIKDGKVRNDVGYGVGSRFNGGLQLIYDLRVTSQGGSDEPGRLYAFDVQYGNMSYVDEGKARQMYRTLTVIKRKLRKLQETRGYVKTFGEYVGRVAEVLGADTKIIQDLGRTGYGWSHDDHDYRFHDVGYGKDWIDQTVTPSLWPPVVTPEAVKAAADELGYEHKPTPFSEV